MKQLTNVKKMSENYLRIVLSLNFAENAQLQHLCQRLLMNTQMPK